MVLNKLDGIKIILIATIVVMANLSASAQEIRRQFRQKRAFDRIDYLGMNGLDKRREPFDVVIETPSFKAPVKRRFDRIDSGAFGFNKRAFDRIDTGHFSNMFRKRSSSSSEESAEDY